MAPSVLLKGKTVIIDLSQFEGVEKLVINGLGVRTEFLIDPTETRNNSLTDKQLIEKIFSNNKMKIMGRLKSIPVSVLDYPTKMRSELARINNWIRVLKVTLLDMEMDLNVVVNTLYGTDESYIVYDDEVYPEAARILLEEIGIPKSFMTMATIKILESDDSQWFPDQINIVREERGFPQNHFGGF